MQIPVRRSPTDYFYHTYDYDGSRPFETKTIGAGNYQLYSLAQDLAQLAEEARQRGINAELLRLNPQTAPGGRQVLALRLFGLPSRSTQLPRVLLTGGIHAREWVAIEVAYLIAEYLVANFPRTAEVTPRQQAIRELIATREIVIAPLLNPDGNSYTVMTNRNWRKNLRWLGRADFTRLRQVQPDGTDAITYTALQYNHPLGTLERAIRITFNDEGQVFEPVPASSRGVDLNRNFPDRYWGFETYDLKGYQAAPSLGPSTYRTTSGDPRLDTYFGPAACSEPEARALLDLATRMYPVAASIDYHSFSRVVMYPDDSEDDLPLRALGAVIRDLTVTPEERQNAELAENQRGYALGTASERMYPAFGTVNDAVAWRGKGFVYTIELDPGRDNPAAFELPQTAILDTFRKNIRGALALIAAAGMRDPDAIRAVVRPLAGWNVFAKGNELPD